jgi:hypothetical protein
LGVDEHRRALELVPVACTLGATEGPERLAQWRSVFAAHGAGRERGPDYLLLRFRDDPDVSRELQQLVDAERSCCAFVEWAVERSGAELVVRITGDGDALATLPIEG